MQDSSKIVAPQYQGQRGNPVVIPSLLFPQIYALQGDEGARRLIEPARVVYVEVDDPGIIIDVDTPEEYQRLIRKGDTPNKERGHSSCREMSPT